MTSVKKDPKLLYSIEDNVYSLPIENQKIKLKKGTKLFEQLNDKIKIYRNNKESVTVNKVAGKTFLILEQDGIFNLVSDVKHSKKKSYRFCYIWFNFSPNQFLFLSIYHCNIGWNN